MKRLLLLPILILLFSLGLHGQTVTVTGNLKTVLGESLGSNTFVRFRLRNYKPNRPLVSGVGIIGQTTKDVSPDSNGLISTTVYDNDFITPDGTFYTLEFYLQSRFVFAASYTITGASFDFNTAEPLSSVPMAAVPVAESRVFTHIQATPATTWTIIHNFAVREVTLDFYDASFNRIFPDLVTLTDINTVTALFVVAQTGRAVVMRAENVNLTSSISDPVLKVPTTAQSIAGGFDLTLDGNFLLATTGQNIGSPTVRPDAFLEAVLTGVLNNTRVVNGDKYACSAAGINTAMFDTPAGGGIVDARPCLGSMAFTSNPWAGITKPILLLLSFTAIDLTAVIDVTNAPGSLIHGLSKSWGETNAQTSIKAVSGFPANSAMILYAPGTIPVGDNLSEISIEGLTLLANNIAQDGVRFDNFRNVHIERVAVRDALRFNFALLSAGGNSNTAELTDVYANGADTANYRFEGKFVKITRGVGDLGSSTATNIQVFATGGNHIKIIDGHYEGGQIAIDSDGGGRLTVMGNYLPTQNNATLQTCLRLKTSGSGSILVRFIGNKCTGATATTSIGIDIQGNLASSSVIGLNEIGGYKLGVNSAGDDSTFIGNFVSAIDEGFLINSSDGSYIGNRIVVTTGTSAIRVASGTSNFCSGNETDVGDTIVGCGWEQITDMSIGGIGALGAGLDNYRLNILTDDSDAGLQFVPDDDANLTNLVLRIVNAARSQTNFSLRKNGDIHTRGDFIPDVSTVQIGVSAAPVGEVNTARIFAKGSDLVAGDIAIATTGAWGDTVDATVGSVRGNDQWFEWVITAGGANTGANPTIIPTFTDGTWTTAPIVMCQRLDFNAPVTVTLTLTSVTATTFTLTFDGTPTATNTYKFACHVGGV